MRHHRPAACLLSLIVLAGCGRPAAPAAVARPASAAIAAASAASVASVASTASGPADDESDALMRAAFPGWKSDDTLVRRVAGPDPAGTPVYLRMRPKAVVQIDATHRALVTVGEVCDEHGNDGGVHSDQGAAGVHVFELRAGRWVKTRSQDAVAWAGSYGQVSEVEAVQLGAGHPALFVEGSHTGQGETTVWAQLVEIEPGGARVILRDVTLHEDVYGAVGDECEAWVAGTRTPTADDLADEFKSRCHAMTGRWRVEPVDGAPRGDLVIAYTRHRTMGDGTARPRTFESTPSRVVYRYTPAGYERTAGDALE